MTRPPPKVLENSGVLLWLSLLDLEEGGFNPGDPGCHHHPAVPRHTPLASILPPTRRRALQRRHARRTMSSTLNECRIFALTGKTAIGATRTLLRGRAFDLPRGNVALRQADVLSTPPDRIRGWSSHARCRSISSRYGRGVHPPLLNYVHAASATVNHCACRQPRRSHRSCAQSLSSFKHFKLLSPSSVAALKPSRKTRPPFRDSLGPKNF